jgi:secreted trypsin-like serine protease
MDTCKYVYKYDNSKQVCAGNHQYSKDSCQGDSGGPLMNEVNGQWHVAGVVSYGDECAKQGSAGVYARVNHYLRWIRSQIARL